jgi:hypothetical protein
MVVLLICDERAAKEGRRYVKKKRCEPKKRRELAKRNNKSKKAR